MFGIISEYAAKNCLKNPYLYIDITNIGIRGNDFDTFVLLNSNNKISVIIYEYFKTFQLLQISKNIDKKSLKDLANFIENKKVKRLTGENRLLKRLALLLTDYTFTNGYILKYCDGIRNKTNITTHFANKKEIETVAKFLYYKKETKNPAYTYASQYRQLLDRFNNHGCRILVIIKKNRIVATLAECAKAKKIVILGSLFVDKKYRHNGYASTLIRELSGINKKQKIIPILYCYDKKLINFYSKLDYKVCGTTSKMELI